MQWIKAYQIYLSSGAPNDTKVTNKTVSPFESVENAKKQNNLISLKHRLQEERRIYDLKET